MFQKDSYPLVKIAGLAFSLLAVCLALLFLQTYAAVSAGPNDLYMPLVMRFDPPTPTPTPTVTWSDFEIRVVELVNQERANNGCSVMLTMNDKLHTAAYNHSADMIARDFFDHTNPDGDGPRQRLAIVGYDWSAYGENIATGQNSPEEVMADWMSSSGHRANILNCNFTEIGVGYVYAADDPGEWWYHHYWTQVFARPW